MFGIVKKNLRIFFCDMETNAFAIIVANTKWLLSIATELISIL